MVKIQLNVSKLRHLLFSVYMPALGCILLARDDGKSSVCCWIPMRQVTSVCLWTKPNYKHLKRHLKVKLCYMPGS